MKRYVKSARYNNKVDTFLKYHDDENNYHENQAGFEKMYSILEKYDDSNGNNTVDVAFMKASPEDQDRMLALIKPSARYGQPGYCRKLYDQAVNREFEDKRYNEGIIDAFEALIAEGLIDKDDFRP